MQRYDRQGSCPLVACNNVDKPGRVWLGASQTPETSGLQPDAAGLVLTGSFFVAVVAVALIATRSGGELVCFRQRQHHAVVGGRAVEDRHRGYERRARRADPWRHRGPGHLQGNRWHQGPRVGEGIPGCTEQEPDPASLRHEGQKGRDHVRRRHPHRTVAACFAVEDRVCNKGIQGTSGQGPRVGERQLQRQLPERQGLASRPGSRR